MSGGGGTDPTDTYVLEETSITKVSSLDELARLAMQEIGDQDDEDPQATPHGSDSSGQ